MPFATYGTWDDVLAHVAAHGSAHYQPPLNAWPAYVKAEVRGRKVRITPYDKEADPFTADAEHLSRFRRRVPSQTG